MSYGKSKQTLAAIPSYREQQRAIQRPPRGEGKGGAPPWKSIIRLTDSSAAPADVIRLFRAAYPVQVAKGEEVVTETLSFYPYTEHGTRRGGHFRSAICSAGPFAHLKNRRDPCLGCDQHWADRESMGRQNKFAYTALHLHPYAKVPDVDESGRERINPNNNEPYYTWKRTDSQLLRGEHRGLETRDYYLGAMVFGYREHQLLQEANQQISTACDACKGGEGSISTLVWVCGGCGVTLIDPENTTMSQDEVFDMSMKEVKCAECEHVGFLQEEIECKHCSKPRRSDIFDVHLKMKQLKDPATGKRGGLVILGFTNTPLDPKYLESASANEPPVFHQLNLPRIFAPTPYDRQEELFSLGGMKPDASKSARPWGNKGVPVLGNK
jgi:hypothetical protein